MRDDRPAFLKEADRVIGLMDSDEYRVEMIKAMSAVALAASNTPSQFVFFARFDDLIFVNIKR